MAVAKLMALGAVSGLGARRVTDLLVAFGSVEAILRAKPISVQRVARLPPEAVAEFAPEAWRRRLESAEAELERLKKAGGWAIGLDQADYPAQLKVIADPPPVLFGMGDPAVLSAQAVAVVGTRRATPYGLAATRLIAGDLAAAAVVVVSGLARGIDAAAHRAALEAGGVTVAVMGSGLGRIYPRENHYLVEAILGGRAGAVITEHCWDVEPRPGHFPARNRVISGLSSAVVIVESEETGGAMITADCGLNQGRDVLAVPGPITSRFSRGPNLLIDEGARPATSAGDVLEEIGRPPARPRPRGKSGAPPDAAPPVSVGDAGRLVLKELDIVPVGLDELILRTRLPPQVVAATLGMLEVDGLIQRVPGPAYVRLVEVGAGWRRDTRRASRPTGPDHRDPPTGPVLSRR